MNLRDKLFIRKVQAAHSRRNFLKGAGAALAGSAALSLPWQARAETTGRERKFIFFWAGGGWDTTAVLDPHYDTDGVDMEPMSEPVTMSGLTFTGGPTRLQTERFMARWAPYCTIVNGVNVHSVGHDSATQFVLTGTSASSYSDWPTLLASNGRYEYPLPHVVFSGPSFAGTNGAAVVRAGGGTLLELIDGSIIGRADRAAPLPPPPADSQIDAFVHKRISEYAAKQTGLGKERADGLLANMERSMELEGRRFEAGLDDLGNNVLDQAIKASELMRLGLSRCAMIRIPGGYDTHGDQLSTGVNQDNFYGVLDELFDHLARTPGHASEYLLDEVVVVAMSEFGRTPKLNGGGGKDHWPYGSFFVGGAGVHGGRMVGKTDGGLIAEPIDFLTGQPSGIGTLPNIENLGTALLKLGRLDPNRFLPGIQPLDAILRNPG
ncbi:MAG: DUF1501 domain-containing protein [Myxococcota bacterium]